MHMVDEPKSALILPPQVDNALHSGQHLTDGIEMCGCVCCAQLPPRRENIHVNILVVGACGLGKTTFIRQLFQDFQSKEFEPHDGSASSLEDIVRDPAALCTHLEESVPTENEEYLINYHVQDTPGAPSQCAVNGLQALYSVV